MHCLYQGMSWLLSPEPEPVQPSIPAIADLLVKANFNIDNLTTTVRDDEILKAVEETVGQRDNPLWHRFVAETLCLVVSIINAYWLVHKKHNK